MKISSVIKLLFCAFGHALIFFSYILLLGVEAQFLGIRTFYQLGSNIYRINLGLFLPYALLIFAAWLALQFWLINLHSSFTLSRFLDKKFSPPYLILCGLGYLNLAVWTHAMEGNVFGFVFALPLAIVGILLAFAEIRCFFKT